MAHHHSTPAWAVASPTPPLSLVDRLFLLTHDTRNGKPLIAIDVLGVGLAGAALLELATRGSVSVKHSGEIVRMTQYQHPDEAAQYVLMRIYEGEPRNYPAIEWIGVLRNELYLGVAGTLTKRGIVDEQRSALRTARYVPRQRNPAEEAIAWVYALFQAPHRATDSGEHALLLACLAGALGVAATLTALPQAEITNGLPLLRDQCDVQNALIIRDVHRAVSKLAVTPRR